MSPLTVLLVPPPGDTALIEGGVCRSRPPLMFRRHGPYSDDDRRLGMDRWSPLGDRASDVECALVLVLDGAPVAMGIDRAARVLTDRTVARVNAAGTGTIRAYSVQSRYRVEQRGAPMQPWGVLDLCDAWTSEGARVVLLRDGREVGS